MKNVTSVAEKRYQCSDFFASVIQKLAQMRHDRFNSSRVQACLGQLTELKRTTIILGEFINDVTRW